MSEQNTPSNTPGSGIPQIPSQGAWTPPPPGPPSPPPPVRPFSPTRVPSGGGPGIRGHWLYRALTRNWAYKAVRLLVGILLDVLS